MSFFSIFYRWKTKLSLSIIDQGIFSGANFVLNIFLARWLIPSEYGIFVIAFSIFLFTSGFHYALILEPVTVIGSTHHGDGLEEYLETTVWIHGAVIAIFFIIFLLVAFVMFVRNSLFFPSFLGLTLAIPLILSFWFFRQLCYLYTKPGIALKSSLMYILSLFLGLVILYKKAQLNPFTSLLIISLASIISTLYFWHYLHIRITNFSRDRFKTILFKNWRYGKWAVGSVFVYYISLLIYLPLSAFFAGFSATGALKAMQNLVLPLQKVFVAAIFLFLPVLSKGHTLRGHAYVTKNIYKFILFGTSISICYAILLILFGEKIVKLLYGHSLYVKFIWLLFYLGLIAIIDSISQGLYMGLKALQRSRDVFLAQAVGALFTLSIGIYLMKQLKFLGVILSLLFTTLLIAISLIYFFLKACKK